MKEYEFIVLSSILDTRGLKNKIVLIKDSWNDWWEFETLYHLSIVDSQSNRISIGYVKIAEFQMEGVSPNLPSNAIELPDGFYSIGQDEKYYENLNKIKPRLKEKIFRNLNDLANNLDDIDKYIDEDALTQSLLRELNILTVKGQLHRLAKGGVRLTNFSFTYTCPARDGHHEKCIDFNVVAESNPPSNIHVVIGKNGVGKTYLLSNMIYSLIASGKTAKYGKFSEELFTNIVAVSFSAFEKAFPNSINKNLREIDYTYIGLNRPDKKDSDGVSRRQPPKSTVVLCNEFIKSAKIVSQGIKSERWVRALKILESDELFKLANIPSLLDISDENEFEIK